MTALQTNHPWIPWKKTPNDAETPQCQSQFTPKTKANALLRLLSSLVWIDQYNECNGMISFMEFIINSLRPEIEKKNCCARSSRAVALLNEYIRTTRADTASLAPHRGIGPAYRPASVKWMTNNITVICILSSYCNSTLNTARRRMPRSPEI